MYIVFHHLPSGPETETDDDEHFDADLVKQLRDDALRSSRYVKTRF